MKKTTLLGIAIGIAVALIAVVGLQLQFKISNQQRFYGKPRKQWKELAIADVARRGADTVRLTNEIGKIKAALAREDQAWWSSPCLLLTSIRTSPAAWIEGFERSLWASA